MYINDYSKIIRNSSSLEGELLHSTRITTQDISSSISTSIISDLNERSSSTTTAKNRLNSLFKFLKIILPFSSSNKTKSNCCPTFNRTKLSLSSRPNSLKKIIKNECLNSNNNLSDKKHHNNNNNNKTSIMSISTSYSSKELNWYKMEELKHYYDVLGKKPL
jgi:hypothetical protein